MLQKKIFSLFWTLIKTQDITEWPVQIKRVLHCCFCSNCMICIYFWKVDEMEETAKHVFHIFQLVEMEFLFFLPLHSWQMMVKAETWCRCKLRPKQDFQNRSPPPGAPNLPPSEALLIFLVFLCLFDQNWSSCSTEHLFQYTFPVYIWRIRGLKVLLQHIEKEEGRRVIQLMQMHCCANRLSHFAKVRNCPDITILIRVSGSQGLRVLEYQSVRECLESVSVIKFKSDTLSVTKGRCTAARAKKNS